MINKDNIYGVILAGGSGSRLWPLSREMHPKQLLKLNYENTLFQSTFLRLSNLINPENITSVANVKHSTDIKLQLSELQEKLSSKKEFKVITEPAGRNTAPAIALAALYISKEMANGEDPILIVAPSDHLVKEEKSFIDTVEEGIKLANNGHIVTFGIKPDKPDTGYGYISTAADKSVKSIANNGVKVEEFKEKPDLQTAKKYVEAGTYYWNSGIFMFKASTILNEIKKYTPEIMDVLDNQSFAEIGPVLNYEIYKNAPSISIDYAVMEHSKNITLLPINCGWNDMGSWEAIYDVSDKDENDNYIKGNVIDVDSESSLIYGTSKLVSTIGLKDTVIVETEDAILACDKNRTQDVKKIFEQLKQKDSTLCEVHKTVYRPWGYYTVLQKAPGFQVKIIHVNPQAKLSLQLHYHRSEHWVVLSGTACVVKGDKTLHLHPGDSVDIPATVKHSLQNPGKLDVEIIEIQTGTYLEEDDIVRFEDMYGRV